MPKSDSVLRAILVAAMLALSACTSKPEGTYYADFGSSSDPGVALASSLMKLSLNFEGDGQVTMQTEALGKSEKVKVDADYEDDRIVLTRSDDPKKQKLVFVVEDEHTLRCEQCPDGLPSLWKKQQ